MRWTSVFQTLNESNNTNKVIWHEGGNESTKRNHRSVTTAGGEAWGVVLSAGLGAVGGGVFFDAAAAADGEMILGLGATAGFGRVPPPPPFVRFARGCERSHGTG